MSNALWMFFIDKRKVISKVFIFAFQPRWKSGVRLSETLRRRMTSDAPRRRRNRRRRADERARCERSLEFLPSRAAIVRAIVRASTREDGRLARSRKTHQIDDGGLSHQPRFTADVASSSFSLPFRPLETKTKTKKKRILPFPRTKPPLRRSRAHPLPSTFETRKPEALN